MGRKLRSMTALHAAGSWNEPGRPLLGSSCNNGNVRPSNKDAQPLNVAAPTNKRWP